MHDTKANSIFRGFLSYMNWYCFLTSFAADFRFTYRLSTIELGLCYLPNGLACVIGLLMAGRIQNRDFRIVAERVVANATSEGEKQIPKSRADIRELTHFPIEKARLRSIPIPLTISALGYLLYAWATQYHLHIAVPLVASFFTGGAGMIAFNAVGALMV